jgi:hypothetical protein
MVPKNRPPVECGQVREVFVAGGDLEQVPVSTFNTPHGYIKYATPEVTALELVGYPQHAGGLNNVATVLEELSELSDKADKYWSAHPMRRAGARAPRP